MTQSSLKVGVSPIERAREREREEQRASEPSTTWIDKSGESVYPEKPRGEQKIHRYQGTESSESEKLCKCTWKNKKNFHLSPAYP